MNEVSYDVIIIGGGPAGLTTGVYTGRDMVNTLLLEKGLCGGLPSSTDLIENYPGFPEGIKGPELMNKFKEQAEKFGVKINEFEEVVKVEPRQGTIRVQTNKGDYSAYAVIVGSGSLPKKLGVKGEDKFVGKGISYCATCDGPLFRDKDIAVIGCGNSGLQEGEFMLKFAKSITFIEFLPYMTADKILQERLKQSEKVEFLLNHQLTSINGKEYLNSITLKDRQTGKDKKIELAGVFVYVGFLPNSKFLEGVVKLDNAGYIKTDENMRTSVAGIYAVGDVNSKRVRQIDTACADATIAAISVSDYIKELI